jgi:transposase
MARFFWLIWSRSCVRGCSPDKLCVMDNLAAHKVAGMRQLIEAHGAQLLYLPPYSPDFNPIEQAWANIKQLLRTAKARLVEVLEQAAAEAITARQLRRLVSPLWLRGTLSM